MAEMFWMGIGVTLVVAIVVTAVIILAKRPGNDPGSVSANWVAEHRIDAP